MTRRRRFRMKRMKIIKIEKTLRTLVPGTSAVASDASDGAGKKKRKLKYPNRSRRNGLSNSAIQTQLPTLFYRPRMSSTLPTIRIGNDTFSRASFTRNKTLKRWFIRRRSGVDDFALFVLGWNEIVQLGAAVSIDVFRFRRFVRGQFFDKSTRKRRSN